MRFRVKTTVVKITMDRQGNVHVTRYERHGWTLLAAVSMGVCAVLQLVNAVLQWRSGDVGSGALYLAIGLAWMVLAVWYVHRWRHGK